MREVFLSAWTKHRSSETLSARESLAVEIARAHPEYKAILDAGQTAKTRQQNEPFMHLGLHLTIAEQLAADRPTGIRDLYQRLDQICADGHRAQHLMMECLSNWLRQAHRGSPLSEQDYLDTVAHLCAKLNDL